MKHLYLVDLTKDKSKLNSYISQTLLDNIENCLKNWKKTILYINKRWVYDLYVCWDCNNLKKCVRCDIALTIHKNPEKLVCHHCLYSEDISLHCEKCGSVNLKKVWVGTQQIEESIEKYFWEYKIFRMDSDSVWNITKKKEALENIINSDIIIWTKMITTWFDFKDIWVIWIILLEQELQIPKYNTEEKIYCSIKQLIWRWWRVWSDTNIIIQTYIPNNEMIKNIIKLNYKDFFIKTLRERKKFNYPPFVELAYIRYKDKNKKKAIDYIWELKTKLDQFNNWEYEIIQLNSVIKRDNQFYSKIIIKWKNIRLLLENIKQEIFKNKDLVVIFE